MTPSPRSLGRKVSGSWRQSERMDFSICGSLGVMVLMGVVYG